jgi:hypothetical protein
VSDEEDVAKAIDDVSTAFDIFVNAMNRQLYWMQPDPEEEAPAPSGLLKHT